MHIIIEVYFCRHKKIISLVILARILHKFFEHCLELWDQITKEYISSSSGSFVSFTQHFYVCSLLDNEFFPLNFFSSNVWFSRKRFEQILSGSDGRSEHFCVAIFCKEIWLKSFLLIQIMKKIIWMFIVFFFFKARRWKFRQNVSK